MNTLRQKEELFLPNKMDLLKDPKRGLWGYNTLKRMYPNEKDKAKELFNDEELQLYQPAITKFPRRKTLARTLDLNHQVDLLDISPFSKENSDYKFILTSVDVLSRFAQAQPLKNKTADEIIRGLELMFEERKPARLSFDRGKEFINKKATEFLKDWHVYSFPLNPPMKASMVERFHRTLWQLINRYMVTHSTYSFVPVLQQLIDNYNSKIHSTIKMAPKDVTRENQEKVYQTVLHNTKNTSVFEPIKRPKFKYGDYVRIQKNRGVFDKESKGYWNREIFKISRVLLTNPITYHITDLLDEEISGSFYESDLQKTTKPESFKVDKILQTKWVGVGRNRKKRVLIQWLGYPEKFNSWEDADSYTET